MASEIQVHAQFPRLATHGSVHNVNADLDPSNWYWVHCLTFPVERLRELQFSRRPYKWIRYAVGVVIGAQGDLSLSSNPNSLDDVVDYDAGDVHEGSGTLFYHLSENEKQQMFPLDPKIARLTDTSTASSRRVEFYHEVADRDEHLCVLSRLPEEACHAVHLLPHIKGDEYISTFTRHRSRYPGCADVIEHIDSVRNGLLLNKITHSVLGKTIAFLPTPNFAMDTVDVDPEAITLPGETRYTTHLFLPGREYLFGGYGGPPAGAPIHVSESPDWPPAVLFDAVYASAVVHHFGTETLKDVVSSTWNEAFYPSGIVDQAHSDYYTEEWIAKQERKRKEALARPDGFDLLLTIPYMCVPPDKIKAYFAEAEERAGQEVRRQAQEKVQAWMRQVYLRYVSYLENNSANPVILMYNQCDKSEGPA